MTGQLGQEALALLQAAVAAPGASQATVAAKIASISGKTCSRSAVSLALSGNYPADTAQFEQRIIVALGRVDCPHLKEEISRKDCRDFHTRAAPTSSAFAMRHWRACQGCPNRRSE